MILVTGATGTVGSEVVKLLLEKEQPVRILTRNPDKVKNLEEKGVEVIEGDFNQDESLDSACIDCERVFLLSSADLNQVEMHTNLIMAARRWEVSHVVRMSALGVRPGTDNKLLQLHDDCEKALEESGMAWTHLKPHYFMQNFLMYVPMIQEHSAIFAPMQDVKISMVDVRDIASVAVAALTGDGHANKSYEITGPEAISFDEAATKLGAAIGNELKYVNVSPEETKKSMLEMGMPEWLADGLLGLFKSWESGKAADVSPVVEDVTGSKGRTFEDFARDYASAFKEA